MEEKHSRIPIDRIQETPAEGYYITKEEARRYTLFAAAGAFIFFLSRLLRRKK